MARQRKYELPAFLVGTVTQDHYDRWLQRKAVAHVRRDRKRGNPSAMNAEYKVEIHRAVIDSKGKDCYTGEKLDWSLISKYDNKQSRSGGRLYKATFALLPTVDHVNDGLGPADFNICSWRTNSAKNDLTLPEFLELCEKVIGHNKTISQG